MRLIKMQTDAQKLVAKLQHWYWSPLPPESYVVRTSIGDIGIGLSAHKNYAAFNLIWLSLPLATIDDMQTAATAFMLFSLVTQVKVKDGCVGDHILTKTPQEFRMWYENNKEALPKPAIFTLDKVFENAQNL